MKKILVFLVVLCALATSAFAVVTVSDWTLYETVGDDIYNFPTIVYDGLIEDVGTSGFTIHANPEMWVDEDYPRAQFLSGNVSSGLMSNAFYEVSVTGFSEGLIKYSDGKAWETSFTYPPARYPRGTVYVMFFGDDNQFVAYVADWIGDTVYKNTSETRDFWTINSIGFQPFEVTSVRVALGRPINDDGGSYYLGDSVQGTIELSFP
ncbi:MAG: hypothetical protein J6332_02905, partial [Abditibacteriota bacterium]|nr:hypothetical protein [Abditibacteriota bacterium]